MPPINDELARNPHPTLTRHTTDFDVLGDETANAKRV